MNHVFGYGVRLGAGLTVGAFIGLGMIGAAGYLAMKLSPNKEEKEVSEDVRSNSESAN